jgi:hypothetical protein
MGEALPWKWTKRFQTISENAWHLRNLAYKFLGPELLVFKFLE